MTVALFSGRHCRRPVTWRTAAGRLFPVSQVVLARIFATCVQVE